MKTVHVVGSSGYIGRRLLDSLLDGGVDAVGVSRGNVGSGFDLANSEPLPDYCFEKGDTVVFLASVSGPDQCVDQRKRCWRVNVEGTAKVIDSALASGARVLFFSSDAVFPPDKGRPYDEKSLRGPAFAYGEMKAEVERRFEASPNFKVLRLPYVVSMDDKFTSYLLRCAHSGKVAEVFHPFYRSCTTLSDVVNATTWILSHWDKYQPTYLNVCGSELVSRARIADELSRVLPGVGLSYRIVDPPAGFFENRSAITQMESVYAEKYGIWASGSFSSKFRKEIEKGIRHD